MIHFGTVLYPINSAARRLATAPYVAALADHFASRVLTLQMREDPRVAEDGLVVGRVRRVIGPERTRHITKSGDPVEAIANTTRDEGVDVIVTPTREASRIRQIWRRSATAAVLANVRCPVITCTDDWER